jgi:hypothetical protein
MRAVGLWLELKRFRGNVIDRGQAGCEAECHPLVKLNVSAETPSITWSAGAFAGPTQRNTHGVAGGRRHQPIGCRNTDRAKHPMICAALAIETSRSSLIPPNSTAVFIPAFSRRCESLSHCPS